MAERLIDRAIVLSRVPYQESDLVLGLLCRQAGLVSVVARSARSSRRRFQGLLDFFVVFNAGLSRGRGAMISLASAEPARFFPGILEDLDRLEAGQALIQVARDILRDAPATPAVFDSLELAFGYLENSVPGLAYMVVLEWVLAMAADLGHVPDGRVCPGCGKESGAFIVAPDGRVLCTDRCHPPGRVTLPWPSVYFVRQPLMDNPALEHAGWIPVPDVALGIVSGLVAGITGFSRPSGDRQG